MLYLPVYVVNPGKRPVDEVICHAEQAVEVAETGRALSDDLLDACEHEIATELLLVCALTQLRQLRAHAEVD